MKATCPDCGAQAHIAAFFAEEDGKALANVLAGMSPELGRATIAYLGLFKPEKNALRLSRATKLARELVVLVASGDVCRDERAGVRRPANQAMWIAGIETMLQQRASLSTPLDNHNYLRAVVFGLADRVDAAAERQAEANARAGKHRSPATRTPESTESKLDNQLNWIANQLSCGIIEPDEAERLRNQAFEKYGREDG